MLYGISELACRVVSLFKSFFFAVLIHVHMMFYFFQIGLMANANSELTVMPALVHLN